MIKVLFFAFLRDALGQEEEMMDAQGIKVAELKAELARTYKLPKMDSVITVINEEFASDEDTLNDGDVIAFIPPVSGG